jgi:formate-dependent nitrite reductase cytochrome c552 subunit
MDKKIDISDIKKEREEAMVKYFQARDRWLAAETSDEFEHWQADMQHHAQHAIILDMLIRQYT